jgi:hypothetical protein
MIFTCYPKQGPRAFSPIETSPHSTTNQMLHDLTKIVGLNFIISGKCSLIIENSQMTRPLDCLFVCLSASWLYYLHYSEKGTSATSAQSKLSSQTSIDMWYLPSNTQVPNLYTLPIYSYFTKIFIPFPPNAISCPHSQSSSSRNLSPIASSAC